MTESFFTEGGFDYGAEFTGKNPKFVFWGFVVAVVLILILFISWAFNKGKVSTMGESYGLGNTKDLQDSAGAGQPYFSQESYDGGDPDIIELTPTTTPVIDGTDEYGQYRVSSSGRRFYPIMNTNKEFVRWGNNFILYKPIDELTGGIYLNDPSRYRPGSLGYRASCMSADLREYERSPWGWMVKAARTPPVEGFSVADQDSMLIQKSMGY